MVTADSDAKEGSCCAVPSNEPSPLVESEHAQPLATEEAAAEALAAAAEVAFLVPPQVREQYSRGEVQMFHGAWDAEGVYFYQAFRSGIADWALQHGHLGGPAWNPKRMTWIKPSFAWMLYRSGYGRKPGQERVLRIKLPHAAVAELLSRCKLVFTSLSGDESTSASSTRSNRRRAAAEVPTVGVDEGGLADEGPECGTASARKAADGGSGRVQWDPERDLFSAEGRQPRAMLRTRAIQIGISGSVSEFYVESAVSIEDVTQLAHAVQDAHLQKRQAAVKAKMDLLAAQLPEERPYMPQCSQADLLRLGLLAGEPAAALSRLGRGRASCK